MNSIFVFIAVILTTCVHGKRDRRAESVNDRQASEEGFVGSGNYTYYTLATSAEKPVTLMILLHSLEGDADLYIAGKNRHPTFDVEEHNFQSTSCGNDYVRVPSHFVREQSPIVIGVYGHPRFSLSKYLLEVLWEPEVVAEKNSYDEDSEGPVTESESDEGSSEPKSDFLDVILQIVAFLIEVLL